MRLPSTMILAVSVLACDAFAHDGPHDDFPVPGYAWHQQNSKAVVTVNHSKNTLMISLQAPAQIFTDIDVLSEKKLKAMRVKLGSELVDYSKVLTIAADKDCKPGFKSVDLQHKHRLLVDRPKDKVKGKDKDKFIKPFTEVLASFKVICPKGTKITGFQLKLFDTAEYLSEAKIEYRSKTLEQSQNFYPHKMQLK